MPTTQPPTTQPDQPNTVQEAASKLRCSRDHILNMLAQGKLTGRKTAKRWLISSASVQKHLPQEEKP